MAFAPCAYEAPDFRTPALAGAPDVATAPVTADGVAPDGYHATSIYPEYFKLGGRWVLAEDSRMDCVAVLRTGAAPDIREFRRLRVGDPVALGRTEDGREGIYVHAAGFRAPPGRDEAFAFRTGRSRETAYSRDYDRLYDLLRYEREHGYIVWVLGPAVSFDHDCRRAMAALVDGGYVHAVLAGNAMATHDLEAAVLRTALGQDIYTQALVPNGHYHHLDILNRARRVGSLERFAAEAPVRDGIVAACLRRGVPLVLAGSIRDDGPLPPVYADVYAAQDAMRAHLRRATTVITIATQLHSIAACNMTPAYRVLHGTVRPVYIYSVDISEFAVNKLRDRGTLEATSIVTNVQDFLVNVERNLAAGCPAP